MIYLDYNATSPLRGGARVAMSAAMEVYGNPSSVHGAGRKALALIEDARQDVIDLIGGCGGRLTFTSGGTEAINTAIRGTDMARIAVSAIEHDAVLAAAEAARDSGGKTLEVLPVTPEGALDLNAITLHDVPTLYCVQAVNNETGVIQPVEELAALLQDTPHRLFVDAVQGAGKISLGAAILNADMAALSAHKIGGPKGVGALWLADGLDVPPLMVGGGQERRRRAGTENVMGIAGFGAAAKAALVDLEADRLPALQQKLEAGVRGITPDARIIGSNRVANTSCIVLPGVKAETQVMTLDLDGIAVSAGSACSSGKVKPSHVLTAMGESALNAACAIRVSTGFATTTEDIDGFLEAYKKLVSRLTTRAA
ncbi:MAG: cysteine desulfurase family protein [Alphaproteobacteria bacterium]